MSRKCAKGVGVVFEGPSVPPAIFICIFWRCHNCRLYAVTHHTLVPPSGFSSGAEFVFSLVSGFIVIFGACLETKFTWLQILQINQKFSGIMKPDLSVVFCLLH